MNQDSLISFLEENIDNWQNKSFLLAVSGGVDSMVLLDLFIKAKLKFSVAHCNFQLREQESDLDEELVKNYCREGNIPVYVKKFSTKEIKTEKPTSTQMLARELRYEWFKELKEKLSYDFLVVAHHSTDQLETILLNLIRGTGISGLRGMKKFNQYIVRPLLKFSKEDVLEYAKKNNIQWREDASNQKNDYKRNLIRNEVLPLLKKINPSLEQTLFQTINKISDAESVFQSEVKTLENQLKLEDKFLLSDQLLQSQKVNPTLLFEILKKFGFVYEQVKNLFKPHISGVALETEDYQLIRIEQGWQLIEKQIVSFKPIKISLSDLESRFQLLEALVFFKKVSSEGFKLKKSKAVLTLDLDKVQFPLCLRQWKQGDKFMPFGMKGMKKVSDFLIDAKVPLPEKNKVFVLEEASGNILGVLNFRSDERFKVTNTTNSILEITYAAQ